MRLFASALPGSIVTVHCRLRSRPEGVTEARETPNRTSNCLTGVTETSRKGQERAKVVLERDDELRAHAATAGSARSSSSRRRRSATRRTLQKVRAFKKS